MLETGAMQLATGRPATPVRLWFALAIAIVIADQLTKFAASSVLCCRPPIELAPFFNLVLAHNTGAAFSFLAGQPGWQRWFFAAIALVAAIVISVLLVKHARQSGQRRFCAALTLILGGAVGNLIDRLLYGYVVDFVDVHVAGWHWPAFNVADSAISIGAVLMIIDSLFQNGQGDKSGDSGGGKPGA
jgi:signal peptidase II